MSEPADPQQIVVTDNEAGSRFDIHVGDRLGGLAAYRTVGGTITFTHTEIKSEFEGQGLGGTLAKAALDSARDAGLTVVAQCPFIAEWIRRHPDYQDLLLPPADRG